MHIVREWEMVWDQDGQAAEFAKCHQRTAADVNTVDAYGK